MNSWLARIAALSAILIPLAAQAEQSEVRIALGRPVGHLPFEVMQFNHIYEKHLAAAGMPNVKVTWTSIGVSSIGIDGLLAGNFDILSTGATSLILLWSKTAGSPLEIKGVS